MGKILTFSGRVVGFGSNHIANYYAIITPSPAQLSFLCDTISRAFSENSRSFDESTRMGKTKLISVISFNDILVLIQFYKYTKMYSN